MLFEFSNVLCLFYLPESISLRSEANCRSFSINSEKEEGVYTWVWMAFPTAGGTSLWAIIVLTVLYLDYAAARLQQTLNTSSHHQFATNSTRTKHDLLTCWCSKGCTAGYFTPAWLLYSSHRSPHSTNAQRWLATKSQCMAKPPISLLFSVLWNDAPVLSILQKWRYPCLIEKMILLKRSPILVHERSFSCGNKKKESHFRCYTS